MKKSFLKHLVSFTAVMSMCAAVLAGTGAPSGGTPDPVGNGGRPIIIIENPSAPTEGEEPGQNPGVEPQDDKSPNIKQWE